MTKKNIIKNRELNIGTRKYYLIISEQGIANFKILFDKNTFLLIFT